MKSFILSFIICLGLFISPSYALEPDGIAWYEHLDFYSNPIVGFDRWCWDDENHTTMGEMYAVYITWPGHSGWSCAEQTPGECVNGRCCADIGIDMTASSSLNYNLAMIQVLGRDLCNQTESPNESTIPMYQQCTFTIPPGWCN